MSQNVIVSCIRQTELISICVSVCFLLQLKKTEKALHVHRPGCITFNSHNGN